MPGPSPGKVRGNIFRGPGKSHYFLLIFRPGPGQFRASFHFSGPGQVWGTFLDSTRHDFV